MPSLPEATDLDGNWRGSALVVAGRLRRPLFRARVSFAMAGSQNHEISVATLVVKAIDILQDLPMSIRRILVESARNLVMILRRKRLLVVGVDYRKSHFWRSRSHRG
jgi:hypothetical protein